jgi:hypothetical protein
MGEDVVGELPLSVYRIVAPAVAVAMLTSTNPVNAPPAGEKLGVATGTTS